MTVDGRVYRSQSMWVVSPRQRLSKTNSMNSGSSHSSSSWSLSDGSSVSARVLRKRNKKCSPTRRVTCGPCLCGDVNGMDDQGRTLLFYAVRYGQCETARQLLDAGSDPNWTDNIGNTPLHEAIESAQSDVVEILLKNENTNINAVGRHGYTPLMVAVSRGCMEAVRLLHKYGANINHCDDEGNPPIYKALKRGWSDIAEFLFDKHCDVNIASSNQKTCLHAVSKCSNCKTDALVKRLLRLDYDFTRDAEWLLCEGCPVSSDDDPRLHDKILERAGLKPPSRKQSLLRSGKKKIIKTFRSFSK